MRAKVIRLEGRWALLLEEAPPGLEEGEEVEVALVPKGVDPERLRFLMAYLLTLKDRDELYRRLADA
ncbi:hypothetical protein [Meiothermus rufus]|uniref:hypothetical protein n=1 Tax=Meiothermus rufus TaxID=604332 RepID=UPI0004874F78|nr:hypothetical protein [Meiothermus rufus]